MKVFLESISTGERYPIELGTFTIGRKGADITAVHELVSAKHAEISFTGSKIVLTDLNSTNGTFLNGQEVKHKFLKNKDIISLGSPDYNTVPSYMLLIESNDTRVSYEISIKKNTYKKFLLLLPLLFFIWFLLAEDTLEDQVLVKVEEAEQSRVNNFTEGKELLLIYGCRVYVPNDFTWLKESSYDKAGVEDTVFDTSIGITTIWNKTEMGMPELKAVVSFQKFRGDFVGDTEQEALTNFIWHEKVFLSENKINSTFVYRKTKSGIWQWVSWFDGEFFNLYANTINKRFRVILRVSSDDMKLLNSFFVDFVDSLWCKY